MPTSDPQTPPASAKKLWDNSLFTGVTTPLIILVAGALIIWGVGRLLTAERDYKDLVNEMRSKTFGNRWVAAYELSKHLTNSQIKDTEIPELVTDLDEIYSQSPDPRTQQFIITALGTMRHPMVLPTLAKALKHTDSQVQFQAVVALGNFPLNKFPEALAQYPTEGLKELLSTPDTPLRQAVVLALAHQVSTQSSEVLIRMLADPDLDVRYAAATGLVAYREPQALALLKEILLPLSTDQRYRADQRESLQANVLLALERTPWMAMRASVEEFAVKAPGEALRVRAKALLSQLSVENVTL